MRRPRNRYQRAILLIASIISLLAVNSAQVGPSSAEARSHPLRVGIAYGDTLVWMSSAALGAALDDAVSVGARWVRADLSWIDVQDDGKNVYRWERFDRLLAAAHQRKLTVLPVLAYTPAWARRPGCGSPSCPPADPRAFATFVRAATARYAPRGIHTWEIWNEPNLSGFWEPAADPAHYTSLLRAAAGAIRAVDTSATIVLGGLAATATAGGNMAQNDFLQAVARAGGTRLVDAVGYHPYTYPYLPGVRTEFGTSWERMTGLRRVLTQYGTPAMPLWITEVGAPTGGPGTASDGRLNTIRPSTDHVTEAWQARIATSAIATAARDPYVAALIWYSDRDLGASASTSENHYGLRRADGSAKPAFGALRAAVAAINR